MKWSACCSVKQHIQPHCGTCWLWMYHRWNDVKAAFIFSCMKNSYASETNSEVACHLVSLLRSCGPKFPAGSCSLKALTGSRLEIHTFKEALNYLFSCCMSDLLRKDYRPAVVPFPLCGTAILRKGDLKSFLMWLLKVFIPH